MNVERNDLVDPLFVHFLSLTLFEVKARKSARRSED